MARLQLQSILVATRKVRGAVVAHRRKLRAICSTQILTDMNLPKCRYCLKTGGRMRFYAIEKGGRLKPLHPRCARSMSLILRIQVAIERLPKQK